jgi:hypothetical protein
MPREHARVNPNMRGREKAPMCTQEPYLRRAEPAHVEQHVEVSLECPPERWRIRKLRDSHWSDSGHQAPHSQINYQAIHASSTLHST